MNKQEDSITMEEDSPKKKPKKTLEETIYHRKTTNKRRGGNSPVIGDNGYLVKEGEHTKFTNINRELFNLPEINMRDPDQVMDRLNEYFRIYAKYDLKPTVAGMAYSLNCMSRTTLVNIVKGTPTGGAGYVSALPKEIATIIKKAYFLMENNWESYMMNGKINPVTGIFLAKNNFGYVDKTETVLTPNTKPEEEYSVEDIKKRYDSSDSTKRLSSDFSDSE